MSNTDTELLKRIEQKLDLLLNEKFGASQKPSDELQGPDKKAPRKRQAKVKPVDFKTFYRKRGII